MILTRVSSKDTFSRFQTEGIKVSSGPVSVVFVPIESKKPQVAMAITKKFGSAVDRNRARRRLRHAFDETIDKHTDLHSNAYLLFGSRKILSCDYAGLVNNLGDCCQQIRERS